MAGDLDWLSKAQVTTGFWWLAINYGARIRKALTATQSWALQDSIPETLVIAIALKETGPLFIGNLDKVAPSELLGLLIGDASGDFPGTESDRKAFPKNAAAFRAKYDTADDTSFSDMLVEEANKSRKRLKGWPERTWIYKGYGLFQYDLQNVVADETFFRDKLWYNFDDCMARMLLIFAAKYKLAGGDLRGSTVRYNGAGAKAELYADKVFRYKEWCDALWIDFLEFEHRVVELMAPTMGQGEVCLAALHGVYAGMAAPAASSVLRPPAAGQGGASMLHIQPSAHIHAHSTPPWIRPDGINGLPSGNEQSGIGRFFPRFDR